MMCEQIVVDGEKWRPLPIYPYHYEASHLGRIRNGKNGHIFKGTTTKYGRLQVTLRHKTYEVHRLVAMVWCDQDENLVQVNHKDGNPLNNKADNLEWCTRDQNERHAVLNRLKARGEKNGSSKLTREIVEAIRNEYVYSVNGVSLAKKYGVTPRVVYLIVRNELWKSL